MLARYGMQAKRMNEQSPKKTFPHKHIHRRILFQLVAFIVIAIIMFGIVAFDVVQQHLNPSWIIAGGVLGGFVGWLVGRIFLIGWHEDTQKVIISMDKMSILLIVAYVVFRLVSEHLLGEFIHGQELTMITYSFLGGIMVGRMLSIVRNVIRVLKNQHIL